MANILIKQGREIAGSNLVTPSTKADKTDLSSIIQTGTASSQAISSGTYFYLNDVLVRAKVAIANGATFTLNTNYEIITAGALNDIINRGSVKVTANGTKTNAQGLNELFALIDGTKMTGKSYLKKGAEIYHLYNLNPSSNYVFTNTIINSSNTYTVYQLKCTSTGSQLFRLVNGTFSDLSSGVLSSDIEVFY